MTTDELQKREAELKRNESAWRSAKVNIERDCLKIKAEIDSLIPKRDALVESVAEEGNKVAALVKVQADLKRDNDAKTVENERLDNDIEEKESILSEVETSIQTRKDNADTEVTQHSNKRHKELKDKFTNISTSIDHAQTLLKSATASHKEEVDKTEKLKETAANIRRDITHVTSELSQLKTTRDSLNKEISELTATNTSLNSKVAKKRLELVEIDKKRTDFEKYEKKAWKVLNAMDESLQGRLTEVEKLEQFAANKQTFLPPR